MKSIQIRKGTWHYWVATVFRDWEPIKDEGHWACADGKMLYNDAGQPYRVGMIENDFCSYTREVIIGSLLIGLIAAACAGIVFVELYGAYELAHGLLGAKLTKNQVSCVTAFLTTCCIAAFAGIIFGIKALMAHRREQRIMYPERYPEKALREPKPDGFVKLAYRSFKDKVCYRVTVVGDSE